MDDAEDPACTPVTVTGADGAQLSACTHGGHVLGWVPAGGVQRLWLSPTARCAAGSAIRGGVPVIFPQFAGRGPLPKHGFARDRAWRRIEDGDPGDPGAPDEQHDEQHDGQDDEQDGGQPEAQGPARWSASLTDDDATRRIWPHGFELVLTATAGGAQLELELTATNTGDDAWSFTAALHGYLVVRDPGATITGVGGLLAEDNAAPRTDGDGGPPLVPLGGPGEAVPALTARDVAVLGLDDPVELVDPLLGTVTLTAGGFTDRVLWNPGPQHGLPDVPDGAEAGFVCIEAARLSPVTLAPGESWTGRQVLVAEPVAGATSLAQEAL